MKLTGAHKRSRYLNVEITPMIDVVFLLIIFFLTTAQFTLITRENVDLPDEPGEQDENPDESGLVINITAEGEFVVATETLTLAQLDDLIEAEIQIQAGGNARELKLLIRADENGDTTALNRLITQLHARGVGAARMATEVK